LQLGGSKRLSDRKGQDKWRRKKKESRLSDQKIEKRSAEGRSGRVKKSAIHCARKSLRRGGQWGGRKSNSPVTRSDRLVVERGGKRGYPVLLIEGKKKSWATSRKRFVKKPTTASVHRENGDQLGGSRTGKRNEARYL